MWSYCILSNLLRFGNIVETIWQLYKKTNTTLQCFLKSINISKKRHITLRNMWSEKKISKTFIITFGCAHYRAIYEIVYVNYHFVEMQNTWYFVIFRNTFKNVKRLLVSVKRLSYHYQGVSTSHFGHSFSKQRFTLPWRVDIKCWSGYHLKIKGKSKR